MRFSFLFRVHFLTSDSFLAASDLVLNVSKYMIFMGRRFLVYLAPSPLLCLVSRFSTFLQCPA